MSQQLHKCCYSNKRFGWASTLSRYESTDLGFKISFQFWAIQVGSSHPVWFESCFANASVANQGVAQGARWQLRSNERKHENINRALVPERTELNRSFD
jgi:hypothetical protein